MNKHKRTLVGVISLHAHQSLKRVFTKEKIPKLKGETKGKSLKLENEQKIFKLEYDKKKNTCKREKAQKDPRMRNMKIPIQLFQWIKLTKNLEKRYLNKQKKDN